VIGVFLLALGLVLIVEGLVWVLAPSLVERLLAALQTLPPEARRQVGALAVVLGLVAIWGAFQLGLTLAS
jgi:hypothetical protein